MRDEPILRLKGVDQQTSDHIILTPPLRAFDGWIVGTVILLQDLTETKRIEETLEHRLVKLIGLGPEIEQSAHR